MKIIEKVEIKHFRSFLGTPKPFELEVKDLKDLNIFSGANDSGKSNILRALNLFFNDEVSHGIPFDFNRDFFIGKRDSGHKVIEIGISFDLSKDTTRDKFLPEKFKISKFYDRNGFRNYIYTFHLKGKKEEIRIDSRPENNKDIKNIFNPTVSEENISKREREWIYRVKFSGFLNKGISFEYIPAIRDKNFFSQLFGRLITQIKTNEDDEIEKLQKEKNKIINWEKTLTNKTEKREFKDNIKREEWREERLKKIEEVSRDVSRLSNAMIKLEEEINKYSTELISSINFLDSEFKIGKNLREFFEGFDVGTGEEKTISLNLRGDGIQAKFVPKILDFMSTIASGKKYFLWGFEEPENSAEYKNQQQLAQEFKETFSRDKQIFLTTHSEEFLQLYDGNNIVKEKRVSNLYHVKKLYDNNYGEYSQIYLFDIDKNEFEFLNQKSQIDDDLGQSHLRAKYSKELKKHKDDFLEQKEQLQIENNKLKDILQQNIKPVIFVEDQYTELYKITWLKIFNKNHNKDNFKNIFDKECPFSIFSTEGASNLSGFLRAQNIDFWINKKLIGIFDFDQEGVRQFKIIKNESCWKNNYEGKKTEGIYKKRKGHDCFCAMLIPIPKELQYLADLDFPSFVEIENLLPVGFLTKNNFIKKKVTTGNTTYFEIIEKKKSKIWKKVFDLKKEDLINFLPFFEKINKLFGLN
jgi:predicted ATP-dependent endonuclease of OLD family/regulator of replication initiation timing